MSLATLLRMEGLMLAGLGSEMAWNFRASLHWTVLRPLPDGLPVLAMDLADECPGQARIPLMSDAEQPLKKVIIVIMAVVIT